MAIITIPLTIDTAAYSTGDVVGGEIVIPATNSGLILSVSVFDDDNEGVQLDLFFFDGDLTGTSGYTNNAAFAINAADKSKLIGVVSIATTDYFAVGSDKMAMKTPVNIPIGASGGRLIVVIRSTTTFTATTDLILKIGILER